MIELIELTKYFRNKKAVDGITLRVPRGRLFGFLGPNGAGKTTTLKMMAGVLKPSRGRILIAGKDLSRDAEVVKRITAFIPDQPFLYEKLTALEFLNFIGDLYGLERGSSRDFEIDRLLALFDLTAWRNDLLEGYSHGMKQRVVLCGALLHKPAVLIVDEPMVGLDPGGARLVKEIFRKEAAKGTTVFLSTHSLEVAEDVCDEIAIIQEGKIRAQGSPDYLKSLAGVDGNLEQVFLKLTKNEWDRNADLYSPETED